jgi:hypothetical protein
MLHALPITPYSSSPRISPPEPCMLLNSPHTCYMPCQSRPIFHHLGFPHQNPACYSHLPQTCYMPCQSHPIVHHPDNAWRGVQIMALVVSQFSPASCYVAILFLATCKKCPTHVKTIGKIFAAIRCIKFCPYSSWSVYPNLLKLYISVKHTNFIHKIVHSDMFRLEGIIIRLSIEPYLRYLRCQCTFWDPKRLTVKLATLVIMVSHCCLKYLF